MGVAELHALRSHKHEGSVLSPVHVGDKSRCVEMPFAVAY